MSPGLKLGSENVDVGKLLAGDRVQGQGPSLGALAGDCDPDSGIFQAARLLLSAS